MDHNNNLPTRAAYRRSLKHQKKHFYKRWWFWTLIVIIVLAGGGVAGMKMTATGPFAKTSHVSKPKKTTKKKRSSTKMGLLLPNIVAFISMKLAVRQLLQYNVC